MKPMQPWWHIGNGRGEQEAMLRFTNADLTDLLPYPLFINKIHVNINVGFGCGMNPKCAHEQQELNRSFHGVLLYTKLVAHYFQTGLACCWGRPNGDYKCPMRSHALGCPLVTKRCGIRTGTTVLTNARSWPG